jgi:hypothetical protein
MEVSTDQTFVLRIDPYAEEPSRATNGLVARKSRGDTRAKAQLDRDERTIRSHSLRRRPGQMIGRIFWRLDLLCGENERFAIADGYTGWTGRLS